MITLQHTALYFLAVHSKAMYNGDLGSVLKRGIPWVLLPDAIRMYVSNRPISHFEDNPSMTDTSWMKFPSAEVLTKVTKANAMELIEHHLAEGYLPCVIGEETKLNVFDEHNWSHPHFHDLRIHLIQDQILDDALRSLMVNVDGRFSDHYVARHNHSIVLNGKQLREQVKIFEELGFLHLVGEIYKKTGVLLDQDWYEKNVHQTLLDSCYPTELAENTYRYMQIPEYIAARIAAKNFELTDEDKAKVTITDDLMGVLNKMYSVAYNHTYKEM